MSVSSSRDITGTPEVVGPAPRCRGYSRVLVFIFALTPPLVIFRGSVSAVWDRPCAVRDVEPRTNCPGILDRKSPNRQVINNSPLIPFGDAPLNAESASTKPVADPKPEPVPATMSDRKAVHSLLIDRPYGEIVATMDWACQSTGRRCCAPRCVRNTSKASSRRRRARYAHTTNATTPPTASPDGARRKPARRQRRCGHERGRAAS